ncbi:MAG: SDR family oxidoreductase [Planctomycetota bacterium]|jgi:short-subunit dehydrogenase
MSERVWVIGATSGIGQALAERLAQRGARLLLAARNQAACDRIATDLQQRYGAEIETRAFEATDFESHTDAFHDAVEQLGGLDGVIACQGYLANQEEAEEDFELARRMIDVNYTASVSILNLAAKYFKTKKRGWICGVSSVAGDRGRQSNFLYGATKAGMSAYLQGLRNRLYPHGVHVLTVKPGFVDTPMTYGLVNPNSPLVASPEKVADDIVRAIDLKKDVLYTPWFWRGILMVFRLIPEVLFKRLKT